MSAAIATAGKGGAVATLITPERAKWADAINAAWQSTVAGIIETGRLLVEAKASPALPHGQFEAMVEADLSFGARTGQMLMRIAHDQRITNTKHVSYLPPYWGTLHALTKLEDEQFSNGITAKTIHPEMQRSDVARLRAGGWEPPPPTSHDTCTVTDFNSLIGKQFGVIYADPPWSFKVYSGKGKRRSAERHYPTMDLDAIKALPVEQVGADDCALLLWSVMPQLPEALEVIKAWGFKYKTCAHVWVKTTSEGAYATGMGYWTRSNAELCLLATRGSPKRLNKDVHQVIACARGKHSSKPDEARNRIQRLVAGPYLELFGRRVIENWTVWGNEIDRDIFHASLEEVA